MPDRPARSTDRTPLLVALVVATVALLVAGALAGGFEAYAVADPRVLTRVGLPLAEAVGSLSAAATIGLLGLAVFAVPERERTERLVRGAVRLLEPALILVLAGVVALVTAALLQAVYGVRAVP